MRILASVHAGLHRPERTPQMNNHTIIRDTAGAVVMRSHNLRAILDYSRGSCVSIERADLFPHKHGQGGTLGVSWNTGASCLVDFASYDVMREWVRARRIFKGAEIKQVPRA